jgi:hypothetical protein
MNGMRSLDLNTKHWAIPPQTDPVSHHARHALSRRAFLASMGATGAAVGVSLVSREVLAANRDQRKDREPGEVEKPFNATPQPTANTVTIGGVSFHLTSFGAGVDPSSINDFNGFVGVADVQGTGKGTNPDGSTETLLFDTDMRFMNGVYVGVDGAVHRGAFALV